MFDSRDLVDRLASSVYMDFDTVYKLTRMCDMAQICKGVGVEYCR